MKNVNINRRDFIKKSVTAIGSLEVANMAVSGKTLTSFGVPAFELQSLKQKKLSFNKDGKFKIVQFTDIHAVYKQGETDHAYDIMNKILDIEKPDFVIYTGDVVTDNNPKELWKRVTGLAVERNIPFAVVFGNHDSQFNVPRSALMDMVAGLDGCLNEQKSKSMADVYGETNQVLPIYASDNALKKSFILYLFDSNSTNDLPNSENHYDWIRESQIEWYIKQSKQLTSENNGVPYPALAFFHIPLFEYVKAYNNPLYKTVGWRLENECIPAINSGLFSAFVDCKDVKGVFVGHDHDNDYVSYYNGIALGYGRFSGGLNTYHTLCRGARIFELTENKESFETWVRLETGRFRFRITIPQSFTTTDSELETKPIYSGGGKWFLHGM